LSGLKVGERRVMGKRAPGRVAEQYRHAKAIDLKAFDYGGKQQHYPFVLVWAVVRFNK